jgi:hypothetical protein
VDIRVKAFISLVILGLMAIDLAVSYARGRTSPRQALLTVGFVLICLGAAWVIF